MDDLLLHLEHVQRANGSFVGASWDQVSPRPVAEVVESPWITGIILESLSLAPQTPSVQRMRTRAQGYLLGQRSGEWSFSARARRRSLRLNPNGTDDLGTTFLILRALHGSSPDLFCGEVLAKVVKLLTATEVQEGGPYGTWIGPKAPRGWEHVDVATNASIATFLAAHGVHLGVLDAFLTKTIRMRHVESPQFVSPIFPLFFVSQWADATDRMSERLELTLALDIWWREHGGAANPLELALFGRAWRCAQGDANRLEEIARRLHECSVHEILFPYDVRHEHGLGGSSRLIGSTSVSAASVLAFFAEYRHHHRTVFRPSTRPFLFVATSSSLVEREVRACFEGLPSAWIADVNARCQAVIDAPAERSYHALLTNMMAVSEKGRPYQQQLVDLRVAGACLGVARMLKEEPGGTMKRTERVAIDQRCFREAMARYRRFFSEGHLFFTIAHQVIDESHEMFERERQTGCAQLRDKGISFPSLSAPEEVTLYRAKRRMPEMLGPLAVLLKSDAMLPSLDVLEHVQRFFLEYYSAFQLHLDARSWMADLRRGHMNSATAFVLDEWTRDRAERGVRLSLSDLPGLETCFWNQGMPRIASAIAEHVRIARRELASWDPFTVQSPFGQLLDALEMSVRAMVDERVERQHFIRTFVRSS